MAIYTVHITLRNRFSTSPPNEIDRFEIDNWTIGADLKLIELVQSTLRIERKQRKDFVLSESSQLVNGYTYKIQ